MLFIKNCIYQGANNTVFDGNFIIEEQMGFNPVNMKTINNKDDQISLFPG